jgi:hypothetical protein
VPGGIALRTAARSRAADIEAAPQEALNVDIAGSGNIRLLSDPAVVHTDIKGSGRVIRASSR